MSQTEDVPVVVRRFELADGVTGFGVGANPRIEIGESGFETSDAKLAARLALYLELVETTPQTTRSGRGRGKGGGRA